MPDTQTNKRTVILKAAMEEFARQGIAGARLQAIADQSGVTKAMIHYYFDNKQNLFNEVFREAYGVVMAGLLDTLETEETLFKKIEQFVDQATDSFHNEPALVDFIMNSLNRSPETTVALMQELMDYDDSIFENQLEQAASNYEIAPVQGGEVILNMMALCMFPYAGRRFMGEILKVSSQEEYMELLKHRKGLITDTIINWLAS